MPHVEAMQGDKPDLPDFSRQNKTTSSIHWSYKKISINLYILHISRSKTPSSFRLTQKETILNYNDKFDNDLLIFRFSSCCEQVH